MQNSFVPGFRFKEGILHIFTEQTVMLIHAWPRLVAVRKRVNGQKWCAFGPLFRLVAPYRRRTTRSDAGQMLLPLEATPTKLSAVEQRRLAFSCFRFALPKEVAACTERFMGHQWRLLRLFKLEPKALEVAKSNPLLMFCLANAGVMGAPPSLRDLSKAAKWVGPETNGAAKILSKISPESASVGILHCLRVVLRDAELSQALSHLPCVNAGVIALLKDGNVRVCVTPKLLAEVAGAEREKYRGVTAGHIDDIHLMLRNLDRPASTRRYHSVAEVVSQHDEMTREFAKHRLLSSFKVEFPRPPLPGTDAIVPLRAPWELHEEGQEQENCVGSYTERVMEGKLYIYRVLRPQRATLSIERGFDGNWEIGELLQSHNRPVSAETREAVESWLSQFFNMQ